MESECSKHGPIPVTTQYSQAHPPNYLEVPCAIHFIVNSLDSLKPPAVQAPTALLLIRGVLTCAPFSIQKEYFKENWINLGVPMVEVIGAEPEPGVEPTAANAGFANEG
jgi:hypothetical protein